MSKQKLVDPADKAKVKTEEAEVKEMENAVSLDRFTLEDLQAVPESKTGSRHPFEGYPMVYKTDGNGNRFCATHLVVYDPNKIIPQDPSGENLTIRQKDGTLKTVTIKTTHSRVLPDYPGSKNTDIVFDREIHLGDGKLLQNCAFVKSPSLRAQLMFDYNGRTGKILRNNNYLLADSKQISRLRETFKNIINPRLKADRDSALISNETEG
jgi:hypothetical protein